MGVRVSLIQPSDGLCYKWARKRTKRMPLGLAYIAAALEQADHQVSVTDAALDDLSIEDTVDQALACDPLFVGITCTTPLYHQAVAIVERIKRLAPRSVVILGGPHVSALPKATLETSQADFVCIGEGEETILQIIECVLTGRPPSQVVGVAYNWNGWQGETVTRRRRVSERRETHSQPVDLNRCPVPARHLFRYQEYTDGARDVEGVQTSAMFSRGCPGKCSFCGAADTIVRWRDIANVLDELEMIEKQLHIGNVFVNDDTYTSNKKRVLALSRGIVDRGIKLKIGVQLRLDQVDAEICDALFASGVNYVGPGIESGNEQIIRQIGKGPKESKAHMLEKMRLLQRYDWRVRASFVMGMPGETEEQIMETIDFARELRADENAFSILVPYPDSPLWHTAKQLGKVNDHMDFSKFLYYHAIGCNLSAVPTERLLELHEFAYEYVGNPAYRFDDDAVSSGNRPHIPYLASEAFRRHREAIGEKHETSYVYDNDDKLRASR